MRDLAIYGAGGLGREIALMIDQINRVQPQWNVIGYFDDGKAKNTFVDALPVLGGMQEVNDIKSSFSLVVAIADSNSRRLIVEKIKNKQINFPVLIHPQAIIGSMLNKFGEGSIITAGCIFTTGIVLGRFTIVNLACTIGHDVIIGDFCSVMPGCNLSGNVLIGDGSLIGTGTQILQNISIGKECKVGAGAVVISNIKDGATVVGVPANRLI